ncbi:hypothetical protein MRX96_029079 [Rhipicephalus microplus]
MDVNSSLAGAIVLVELGAKSKSERMVGYTMKDIRYRWSDGDTSVRIAKEVELPQFKVLGHVQKAKEVALTTGKCQSRAGYALNTH